VTQTTSTACGATHSMGACRGCGLHAVVQATGKRNRLLWLTLFVLHLNDSHKKLHCLCS